VISPDTPLYTWWGLNKAIFLWVNAVHAPWWDAAMVAVTDAGSAGLYPYWIAMALFVSLVRPAWIPQRNAAAFAIGFAATGILVPWLKTVMNFPRPLAALGRDFVTVVGPEAHSAAFPSGHATFVVLMAATLSPGLPRVVKWALWIFATLVSFSRIAVGAHFPADVVGGAILGLAVALVVRLAISPARR